MRGYGSRPWWYSPKVLFAVLGAAIAIGSTAILDRRIDLTDGQRELSAGHLSVVQTQKANHYGLYLQSEADRIHAEMLVFGAAPSLDAATTAASLMVTAAQRAYFSAHKDAMPPGLDAAFSDVSSASSDGPYRAALQTMKLECTTALKDRGADKGYIAQVYRYVHEFDRLRSSARSLSSALKALDTIQQCEILRYPKYYDDLLVQQRMHERAIAADERAARTLRQQSRFWQVVGVIVILCKDLFGKEA